MTDTVLFVHSSGPQGPGEGSEPLAGRLREALGPSQELHFPIMPDPDEPHYEPWSERLGALLAEIGDPVVVAGHSLGGSVFLKHLAETGRIEGIAGLVSMATPLWGESDWEAEWALPQGWPDAETELPRTHLFHSRDDEEIPFAHLDLYAKRLPEATIHPLDGCGHLYDRGDLSEIVTVISSL